MEHRHLVPEVGGKDAQQLGGQGDLRHQEQGGLSPLQGLLDQAQIDLGLSAPRHPVQQGGRRLSRPAQGVQPLKGSLLLLIEDDGAGRFHLRHGGAAEYLLLLQGEDAALLQGLDGGHGGPGEVAQLLGGSRPQLAQQLGHRIAQRRRPAARGDPCHGLLRRHGQHRQFLLFISDAPLGAGDPLCGPPVNQCPDGAVRVLGPKGGADLFHVAPSAPGQQQLRQLLGGFRLPGGLEGRRPVHPAPQSDAVPQGIVQPRREHGLHTVIDGAEVPLPHPQCQLQQLFVQHRLVVQGGNHILQAALRPLPAQGQDDAVRPPVARPKGDQHPHAGPQAALQLLGDPVVIGPVDGVDRLGHRHLGRHVSHGLPLSPSLLLGLALFQLVHLLQLLVQLAVGHLLDGDAHRLLVQGLSGQLGLGGDLPGPVGHHVHQLIAAGHLVQQVSHSRIQHHRAKLLFSSKSRKLSQHVAPVGHAALRRGENGGDLLHRV